MSTRLALYITPAEDSALWRFGCSILGYDARKGEEIPQLVPAGVTAARFRELTQDPRRYGFHATMKPPFRLAAGCTEEALEEAVERFCQGRAGFVLPRLRVEAVGANGDGDAFIALVEPEPTPELLALERSVVTTFEPFRAPLTGEEIARRRPERLSPRQRDNLARYGYPGVLDEFRFHLTLTGRVPAAELPDILEGLRKLHREMAEGPLAVADLAIFRQEGPSPFRLVRRFPLRDVNGRD